LHTYVEELPALSHAWIKIDDACLCVHRNEECGSLFVWFSIYQPLLVTLNPADIKVG